MTSLTALLFFFFNDTATTEIYTLSLHDALPIYWFQVAALSAPSSQTASLLNVAINKFKAEDQTYSSLVKRLASMIGDRKSTRLNSSHANISYAVFCLKKKKIYNRINSQHV